MRKICSGWGLVGLALAIMMGACGSDASSQATGPTPPKPLILSAASIDFQVPNGWAVSFQSAQTLILTNWKAGVTTGTIRFQVDHNTEATKAGDATVKVGGEKGDVFANWTKGEGGDANGTAYMVVATHKGVQYLLSCVGHSGYNQKALMAGCEEFLNSISFKG